MFLREICFQSHPVLQSISDQSLNQYWGAVALSKQLSVAIVMLKGMETLLCFHRVGFRFLRGVMPNLLIGMTAICLIVVYKTSSCTTAMPVTNVISDLLSCNQQCDLVGDLNFQEITWSGKPRIRRASSSAQNL